MKPTAQGGDAGGSISARLLEFLRFLRLNHYQIGLQEQLDTLRVADLVGVTDEAALRGGLKTLLCRRAQDQERFDVLFEGFWRPYRPDQVSLRLAPGRHRLRALAEERPPPPALHLVSGDESSGEVVAEERSGGMSARHSAEQARFDQLGERDFALVRERVAELARRLRQRLLRRRVQANTGRRIHLRRVLRGSLRYGGLPLDLTFLRRRRRYPNLVLLLDVSRSMSPYSQLFLHFLRAFVMEYRRAEAFAFHTRLVPLGGIFRETSPRKLAEKLTLVSSGWHGGTRIGESLAAFNREHAAHCLNGRAIVLIVSDGYDTSEPGLLAGELQLLKRKTRTLIWLNPLLGRASYTPTARGMSEALPYVDAFLPAGCLADLEALGERLAAA